MAFWVLKRVRYAWAEIGEPQLWTISMAVLKRKMDYYFMCLCWFTQDKEILQITVYSCLYSHVQIILIALLIKKKVNNSYICWCLISLQLLSTDLSFWAFSYLWWSLDLTLRNTNVFPRKKCICVCAKIYLFSVCIEKERPPQVPFCLGPKRPSHRLWLAVIQHYNL